MIKLVQSGKEPVITGAVAWLEAHGIPVTLIQSISLEAKVGEVARITVTMIVDEPDELAEQ